ncbi:hypothetical protein niasHS_005582 [Heterodera schachtii]|uniref:Gland protein n=1 Tax=Heterodera schachtii TaxID=97005 RepID=A0ABD2JZ06_HETSC
MFSSSNLSALFLASSVFVVLIIGIKMDGPTEAKGAAPPNAAGPMGLLLLLNGKQSAANEKGKVPSGESKPNPGQKPSGERQKRDVLGHAGGYVGGWDHPIDSTVDWAKSQWNDANWLADVVNRNGWENTGAPTGGR